jgi:hypothetical protein
MGVPETLTLAALRRWRDSQADADQSGDGGVEISLNRDPGGQKWASKWQKRTVLTSDTAARIAANEVSDPRSGHGDR